MTTEVVLTGTGVPHPVPGRAGAGTLVRSGNIALQFDAGRGTVLRLVEAGTRMSQLAALFVTHVHSDHVIDIPDVVLTRWVQDNSASPPALPIVAPQGSTERFLRRMLEPFEDDIALRMAHVKESAPELVLSTFPISSRPASVWESQDGSVTVSAVAVHHEPVDAVAYRVHTPDGVIVISGDTSVCEEVEHLAAGADVVVHEACRATAMSDLVAGTIFETIFRYHADTALLGEMAQRARIPCLVLTHLIPPPRTEDEEAAFELDVRQAGYTGRITVGRDLTTIILGAD